MRGAPHPCKSKPLCLKKRPIGQRGSAVEEGIAVLLWRRFPASAGTIWKPAIGVQHGVAGQLHNGDNLNRDGDGDAVAALCF